MKKFTNNKNYQYQFHQFFSTIVINNKNFFNICKNYYLGICVSLCIFFEGACPKE